MSKWIDGPTGLAREVWTVRGPAPFGGLTAHDEDQARSVADMLNRLYGRTA